MLRTYEGRISRAQSALEQLYQNFGANSREAGGLPTQCGFPKLFGLLTKAAVNRFYLRQRAISKAF
jgi:hypothetical protein